jgi:phenylacetate-coenzyme A ligase PaaK-like adenylate-forming protein
MPFVAGVIDRLHGNLVVLSQARGQRSAPYLPEERLYELRDANVRELVRYAAETVPYYRQLFRREGIDPREIRTAADLERLPLLPRAEVQREPTRFVSESRLGRESIRYVTSGSTGSPVDFRHDRRSLLRNYAYSERQRHVEVRLCGKSFRYRKVGLVRGAGTATQARQFYRANTWIPITPRRTSVHVTQPIDRVIEEIHKARPDVMRGYGSFVEFLFRHLAATGVHMHLPKVVVYGSDMMTAEGRELIEREFGIPVVSHYNATECFHIAYTCEQRRHFHLHPDLCHVMVVRAGGRKAAAGEQGEIAITNLVNRGTILINYLIGDTASLVDGRCTCGRTTPLLGELGGRTEDTVRLDDGTIVYPRFVWDSVKVHPEVLRYQLVQREPRLFELRLVTRERAHFDRVAPTIASEVSKLYGGAAVEATFHEDLEAGPGGKFRSVVALAR